MGKLAEGNIRIYGLYEWGNGWLPGMKELWNEFWLKKTEKHSEYVCVAYTESRSFGKQFYLVGIGMSIYLHPMSTSLFVQSMNSAEQNNLKDDMEHIAEYLTELQDFYGAKGVKISWDIAWRVKKADYNGIDFSSYVPDLNNEKFLIESK